MARQAQIAKPKNEDMLRVRLHKGSRFARVVFMSELKLRPPKADDANPSLRPAPAAAGRAAHTAVPSSGQAGRAKRAGLRSG